MRNYSSINKKISPRQDYSNRDKITKEKLIGVGLKNEIGEQNCFINVLIQAVYHIKEIRKFLLEVDIDSNERNNILNELKYIIRKYYNILNQKSKISEETVTIIDPVNFRKELSDLFKADNKFQVSKMDDPAEVLFALLNFFHSYVFEIRSLKYIIDRPCNPQCLSHNLFWINILEQISCECGATSEVLQYDYNYFIFESYVKEILILIENKNFDLYRNNFFTYVKFINSKSNVRCPTYGEKCEFNKTQKHLYLLNSSNYLNINLIWRESNPLMMDILKLYLMIPQKLRNSDLFELADRKNYYNYELFGMICYWGLHYICYFKDDNSKNESWVCYDDSIITSCHSWKDVIGRNLKGHFHPTILFYRKLTGTKLSSEEDNLSEVEINNFMNYCQEKDKNSETMYKIDENSRIRPLSDDKKKTESNYLVILPIDKPHLDENEKKIFSELENDFNKIEVYQEKLNESKLYKSSYDEFYRKKKNDKERNNSKSHINKNEPSLRDNLINNDNLKSINKNSDEYINEIKKIESLQIPHVSEDEWICEIDSCKNINKMNGYICLKCREVNRNVYDIIMQQKLSYERSNPSKSIFLNENNLTSIKKNNDLMKSINCKYCEYCMKPNYYSEKLCEQCKNLSKDKSNKNNVSKIKSINNEKQSIYWECLNCNGLNKIIKDYCEKCYSNKQTFIKNSNDIKKIENKNYESNRSSQTMINSKDICSRCSRKNTNKKSICNECLIKNRQCLECLSGYVKPNNELCNLCINKKQNVSKNVINVNPLKYEIRNSILKSSDEINEKNVKLKRRNTSSQIYKEKPMIVQSGSYKIEENPTNYSDKTRMNNTFGRDEIKDYFNYKQSEKNDSYSNVSYQNNYKTNHINENKNNFNISSKLINKNESVNMNSSLFKHNDEMIHSGNYGINLNRHNINQSYSNNNNLSLNMRDSNLKFDSLLDANRNYMNSYKMSTNNKNMRYNYD